MLSVLLGESYRLRVWREIMHVHVGYSYMNMINSTLGMKCSHHVCIWENGWL